jgi:hypothetical protein
MNKFLLCLTLGALLFSSCLIQPPKPTVKLVIAPEEDKEKREFVILDYKDKNKGENIPEWANSWFTSGVREIETLNAYRGRFVFIQRNEGNNFNALDLWKNGFNAELDFPRLAASRIEARLCAGVPHPDAEYGAFYEALIRGASDALWAGAVSQGDCWIQKRYLPSEDAPEEVAWEFLILVTIEKAYFSSQLNSVIESLNLNPKPTEEQKISISHIKERFYDGF